MNVINLFVELTRMHAGKTLLLVLIGAVVVAAGVFTFVPSTRPAVVQKWFHQAKGFSAASSPDDALDKLRQALEKRDYQAAKLYLTGDYGEYFAKGAPDAAELVAGVDELRDVMKTTGTKSDKVDFMLFKLDPFPPFKVGTVTKGKTDATAVIHWDDDVVRFANTPATLNEYSKVSREMLHALMPTVLLQRLDVVVKETPEGWKVELPAQIGDRHMRGCVEALRKNATNYRNALRDVKNNIKNNPAVKENFEREFKSNLEKAN